MRTNEDLSLTGRDREVASVIELLRDVRRDPVVVLGERGVGKTWLLGAVADRLQRDGAGSVHALGTVGSRHIPLAAIATWLDDPSAAWPARNDLGRLLTELAYRDFGSTLICVDDVDLVDPLSLQVLGQLANEPQVQLIVTARDEAGAAGSLSRLGAALSASASYRLAPLTRPATLALARTVLGAELDGIGQERLWRLSGGLPLFVRTILEQALLEGMLRDRHGVWVWADGTATPQGVLDVAMDTLGELPAAERDAVELVAVGGSVDRSVLSRMCGPIAVSALGERGLLSADTAGRGSLVRLTRDLYREALWRTSALRARRQLHRLAAASAPSSPERPALAVRRGRPAGSRPAAGAAAQAAHLDALIDAGRPALVGAVAEAVSASTRPSRRGLAHGCAGVHLRALTLAGDVNRARQLSVAYYVLASRGGDRAELASVCLARASIARWAGEHAEALQWSREARALVSSLPSLRLRRAILLEQAAASAALGRVADTDESLALAAALPTSVEGRTDLAWTRARVLASRGRTATAARMCAELATSYAEQGRRARAVECLQLGARLRPAHDIAAQLAAIAAECDGRLFRLLAEHACALADTDVSGVDRAHTALVSAGYAGIVEGPGVRPTPLTWREREVCELAADGLSSAEIAHRLEMSRRTVDNHLQRSYAKVDVRTRRELPRALFAE